MRVLGLCQGQLGDQFIQLPTIRTIKKMVPNCTYTANLNRKYQTVAPVLLWCRDIDAIHLSDGYDNWPTQLDSEYLRAEGFDEIFHPMPKHREDDWWRRRHQVEEVAHMYGLPAPESTQIELECPYTVYPNNGVVIAPIGGGGAPHKTIGRSLYCRVIESLEKLGYNDYRGPIYQLTYPGETKIHHPSVTPTSTTYEGSVLQSLAADFYIGVDTGMTWCLSAFKKPTLGLYSNEYYGSEFVKNVQPTNPNAHYLSAPNLNDIPFEEIEKILEKLTPSES